MAESEADLRGFLEAAGRSLADAQGALAGELVDIPTAVAIADAELEVKATVAREQGELILQPVTSQDAREGKIPPELLSTVRVRYVAVTEDTLAAPSERPTRKPDQVIREVSQREDLVSLDKILGGLTFQATFIPAGNRWLVTARDPDDRPVREIVVADVKR